MMPALDQRVPYWNRKTQQFEGPGGVVSGSAVPLVGQQAVAASATVVLGIATRAGQVADVRVAAITPLTGNATYTVDIHKNGVSILSAPMALLSTTAARVSVAGVLAASPTTVAVGDFFEAVIVDTPGTGTAPAQIAFQVQLIAN